MGDLNINDQKAKGLYAVPKTSATTEFEHEREKLTRHGSAEGGGQSDFANPLQNVQHFALEEGMMVADLGSGAGHYVLAMANMVGSAGRVYAVDVQKDLLENIKNEAARRGYDNVEVVWGDIERKGGTKLTDSLLDLALISNTIFQIEDKPSLLSEAYRVLKPGGTLVVIDWSGSFGGMGPIATEVVSKEQVVDLGLQAGFSIKEEFAAGAHHYGIILTKDYKN